MSQKGLKMIRCCGSWREMGRQYGRQLADELHGVLAFVNEVGSGQSDRYLFPQGIPLGLPNLDELFAGVCEGAGLTSQELIRIQSVEVAYAPLLKALFQDAVPGKCSSVGVLGKKTPDGKVLFGRNYDWLPCFASLGLVLATFEPGGGEMPVAVLNYPGCLYLTTGMNASGLFIELNDGSFASTEEMPGHVHNAWQLWDVLLASHDVSQAVARLMDCQGQYTYIIGIADANRCVSVEWGVHGSVVLEHEPVIAMANHFVQPGWTNGPAATMGGERSSVCRREGLLHLAEAVPDRMLDVEAMKKILAVPVEQGGAQ